MRLRLVLTLALVPGIALAQKAPNDPDLKGPDPEVRADDTQVSLPAVPSFELPAAEPGFIDPQTLRVRGKRVLDTQVRVKGYITWIYDCIADNLRPKRTKKQVQKLIDDDPTLCERPKFYLGTRRDTPPEKALWVVDVPRPPNKLEKQRLPKEELAAWPPVPKFKLGDFVVVTGEFKIASPHSERNSDGLLVFAAIEPAKPAPASKAAATSAPQPPPLPGKKTLPPVKKPVDPKVVNISTVSANEGNKAFGAKKYADAITYYKRAIGSWDGNHLAWYGLGAAYASSADWKAALDAFEHAVQLDPSQSMYQLWSGVAAYEANVTQARVDQAAKENRKPEEVKPDLTVVDFTSSRAYLEAAVAREPKLWRAHFYLGRIFREGGFDKHAAESFTQAIKRDRRQQGPYVALGELYRKWDYTTEAIAVTELGAKEVPSNTEVSDVHFVLGMAYADKNDHKRAIEAFTHALDAKPDNAKAQFQRGQSYFKLKKYKEAKADLEAFTAVATASLEFARQQAQRMLMDIAAKK